MKYEVRNRVMTVETMDLAQVSTPFVCICWEYVKLCPMIYVLKSLLSTTQYHPPTWPAYFRSLIEHENEEMQNDEFECSKTQT